MLRTDSSWNQSLASVLPAAQRPAAEEDSPCNAQDRQASPDLELPADAHALDRLAVGLRAALDRLAIPLTRAAAAFVDAKGWTSHGHARLDDHARERFHRSGKWIRDLAAIGRAVDDLPGLQEALSGSDGGPPLSLAGARIIAARATAETARSWIALARRLSVRGLREHAATSPDDPVSSPDDPVPSSESETPRCKVSIRMPEPARAAFDEGRDLHRAIEGRESSTTSYIEALLAERAASGRDAVDGEEESDDSQSTLPSEPVRAIRRASARERALEQATGNWSDLRSRLQDREEPPVPLLSARVESSLARSLVLAVFDPHDDRRLISLLTMRRDLEQRLDRVLAFMGAVRAWSTLRFAGLEHYAEERLGMSRTSARERVRLARSLERIPELRLAWQRGEIGSMAALEVVRLLAAEPQATPAIRQAWLMRARAATVKRLRDEIRALRRAGLDGLRPGPGAAPLGPVTRHPSRGPHPSPAPHPSRGPHPLSDAEWHASLCRQTGDARARVARLAVLAREGSPDGRSWPRRTLTLWLPPDTAQDLQRALGHPGRTTSGEPWERLLAMVEDFVETWDVDQSPQRPSRVAIYVRDGWRCMAPGCTSRRNLEDHHVMYRSRGGDDGLDNRVCLCRFHHQRGEHGELARVRGRAPLALQWSLGRGGRGGAWRNEIRIFDRL